MIVFIKNKKFPNLYKVRALTKPGSAPTFVLFFRVDISGTHVSIKNRKIKKNRKIEEKWGPHFKKNVKERNSLREGKIDQYV